MCRMAASAARSICRPFVEPRFLASKLSPSSSDWSESDPKAAKASSSSDIVVCYFGRRIFVKCAVREARSGEKQTMDGRWTGLSYCGGFAHDHANLNLQTLGSRSACLLTRSSLLRSCSRLSHLRTSLATRASKSQRYDDIAM